MCVFSVPFSSYAESPENKMDGILNDYPRECSVIIYTQDDGTIYSYNPDSFMYSASVIKLTYAVYVCKQLSEGAGSLDDTMMYTPDWEAEGSGIIQYQGYGQIYTVSELLDYSLRYSDNVAYFMLTYLFNQDGFNDMIQNEWGCDIYMDAWSSFPDINAEFMQKSMTEMYNHRSDNEAWEICWDALMESETSYVREALNKYDVAVKYGSMDGVYHEACYIEAENPYTLVILSEMENFPTSEKFVKKIAVCAENIVNNHYAGKVHIDIVMTEYSALFIKKPEKMNETERKKADVNSDGKIDADDITWVQNYYSYISSGGTLTIEEFVSSYQII